MAVRSKRAAGKKIASRKKSAGAPARYNPNFGRADPSPATDTGQTSSRGGKGAAKKALAKVKKSTAKKGTAKKGTAKKTPRAKKS